jgi:uncharacterized protein (DUF2062 family)
VLGPGGAPGTPVTCNPGALVPSRGTRQYLASYVAGHRRRLQPGHRHSEGFPGGLVTMPLSFLPTVPLLLVVAALIPIWLRINEAIARRAAPPPEPL